MSLYKLLQKAEKLAKSGQYNKIDEEFLDADNNEYALPKAKKAKLEKQLSGGKIDPKDMDRMLSNRNFHVLETLYNTRSDLTKDQLKNIISSTSSFAYSRGNRNKKQEVDNFNKKVLGKLAHDHDYDAKAMMDEGNGEALWRLNKVNPQMIDSSDIFRLFSTDRAKKFSNNMLESLMDHDNFGSESAIEAINRLDDHDLIVHAVSRIASSRRGGSSAEAEAVYKAALAKGDDKLNRELTDGYKFGGAPDSIKVKILSESKDPETIYKVASKAGEKGAKYIEDNFEHFANLPSFKSDGYGKKEDVSPLEGVFNSKSNISPDLADKLYNHYASKGDIKTLVDNSFDRINNLHPHTLDKIINLPDETGAKLKESIATHDSLTPELRNKLAETSQDYDTLSESLKDMEDPDKIAGIYQKIKDLHGKKSLDSTGGHFPDASVSDHANNLASNKNTPNSVIKDLMSQTLDHATAQHAAGVKASKGRWDTGTRADNFARILLAHPSADSEMLEAVLNHVSPSMRSTSASGERLATDDQITRALKDKNKEVRGAWADSKYLNGDHVALMSKDRVKEISNKALSHEKVSPQMINDAAMNIVKQAPDKRDYDVLSQIAGNKALPEPTVRALLSTLNPDGAWKERKAIESLMSHKNATSDTMEAAAAANPHGLGKDLLAGSFYNSPSLSPEAIKGIYNKELEKLHNDPDLKGDDDYLNRLNGKKDALADDLVNYAYNRRFSPEDQKAFFDHALPSMSQSFKASKINSMVHGDQNMSPELLKHLYDTAKKVQAEPDEDPEEHRESPNLYHFYGHNNAGASGIIDNIINQTSGNGPSEYADLLEHSSGLTPEQITQAMDYLSSDKGKTDMSESGANNLIHSLGKQNHLQPEHFERFFNDHANLDTTKEIQEDPDKRHHYKSILDFWLDHNRDKLPEHVAEKIYNHAANTDNDTLAEAVISSDKLKPEILKHAIGHFSGNKYIQRHVGDLLAHHDPDSYNQAIKGYDVNVHPAVEKLKHLKGVVDEQGGSIHKKDLPAQFQNTPGQLLDGQGNLTSESIDKYIEALPKHRFNISHDEWESGNAQMHDDSVDQNVYQINMTNDHVKQLKDQGLWDDFKELHDHSFRSGHPVKKHSIGWARVDESHDGHAHIDEIQSDFGQGTIRQLEAMKQQGHDMPQDKIDNYKKIMNIFKGPFKSINHMIMGGVHQALRQKGTTSTSMDTVEDQAKQSGMNTDRTLPGHMQHTYKQLPKELGYEDKPKKEAMPNTQSEENTVQYRKLVKSLEILQDILKYK